MSSLLEALQHQYPQNSKSSLRSWIKQGRVRVEGAVITRPDEPIRPGQRISLGPHYKSLPGGLLILYEDAHLVAVEKPCGLLSVATAFQKEQTAHALLKDYYRPRQVEVVHRLDQETSGVMLFALTPQGREGLKKLFEVHDLERSYVAIVEGALDTAKGTWESRLVEDAQYRVHQSRDPAVGKRAVTHFVRCACTPHYSWLELTLETGRKNQIRVHCQDAGYPVVGDKKYGSSQNPLKRLCLHAYKLAFVHPVSGKKLQFTSEIPSAFYRLLDPGKSYA